MRALATAAVAALLALAACAPAKAPEAAAPAAPAAPAPQAPMVGMANPASVACVEGGGTLTMYDTAEGQIGMCSTTDGRVCEEWSLFRDHKCDPLPAGATLSPGQTPPPARP